MKSLIVLMLFAFTVQSYAATNEAQVYTFKFKASSTMTFQINKKAATKEDAYKLAAKECFQKLTGGNYPGEEKGLEIIDICANPRM